MHLPAMEPMTTQDTTEPPKPASFAGQLKLDEFMFKNEDGASTQVRRSPRLSTPLGAASPIPLPKQRTSTNLSRSPGRVTKRSTAAKSSRPKAGYAPPSTYAHLPLLPDAVGPDLLVLFVGLNPGIETARSGHAYAHPSNLFWKLLYSSGVTPRPCRAEEDRDMPALYHLGLTNIVSRPSRNGAELSKSEMDDGVAILEEKARKLRPESICIVGKSIWESIWRVRHGRSITKGEFRYGWQDESKNMGIIRPGDGGDGEDAETAWEGAKVFVATSTSGLAASLSPAEKQSIWRELGSWVETRREERQAGS